MTWTEDKLKDIIEYLNTILKKDNKYTFKDIQSADSVSSDEEFACYLFTKKESCLLGGYNKGFKYYPVRGGLFLDPVPVDDVEYYLKFEQAS